MNLKKVNLFRYLQLDVRGKQFEREAEKIIWSSEYRFMVDAWEPRGEEGRDKLRKAAVRSTYPVTRRSPNGVIQWKRFHYYISE